MICNRYKWKKKTKSVRGQTLYQSTFFLPCSFLAMLIQAVLSLAVIPLRKQQSHHRQCDLQVEQNNQVFWSSPDTDHFRGLRLGVLQSWTVPFPSGCKCFRWCDHFCGLSHLCLDRWKISSIPDNQGAC